MWHAIALILAMCALLLGDGSFAAAETRPLTNDAGHSSIVGAPRSGASIRSAVSSAVARALQVDAIVDLNSMEIQVNDGVVSFFGNQATLLACDRAISVAETVPGVRRVISHLEVRQRREADTQRLESDIRYVLLTDPATARSVVGVSANAGGQVTLSGVAASYRERQLAELVVRNIRGVTAVVNRIGLASTRSLTDRQIDAVVREALISDAYVDGSDIDVTVSDGAVALVGRVDNAAQKHRAIDLGWAAGATRVDAAALEVSCQPCVGFARGDRTVPPFMSDQMLESAVSKVLRLDPRTRDLGLQVAARDRQVILTGSVDSLFEKRLASILANEIRDVASVDNRLRVPATARLFSDDEIASRIERSLERNSATSDAAIGVSVADGAVLLEGEATNWLARQMADNAAAAVRGVHEVENKIVVTGGGSATTGRDLDMSWSSVVALD